MLLATARWFWLPAARQHASIRSSHPGPDCAQELIASNCGRRHFLLHLGCRSEEEGFSTYARVRTIEAPPSADLASYWEPPSSALMAPPALLREVRSVLHRHLPRDHRNSGWLGLYSGSIGGFFLTASLFAFQSHRSIIASRMIRSTRDSSNFRSMRLSHQVIEDLEWPGGAVTIRLQRDPPRATFSSSGTGALEIELLVDELGSFHCAIPEVKYSYRRVHRMSKQQRSTNCHVWAS